MHKTLIVAATVLSLSGAAAYAQNAHMAPGATNPPPGTSYSGTGTDALPPSTTGTPRAGALDSPNATAETAAVRSKLQAAGFSDVKGLSRHSDGTWTGRGVKNGVEVAVALDPAGNVMVQ